MFEMKSNLGAFLFGIFKIRFSMMSGVMTKFDLEFQVFLSAWMFSKKSGISGPGFGEIWFSREFAIISVFSVLSKTSPPEPYRGQSGFYK